MPSTSAANPNPVPPTPADPHRLADRIVLILFLILVIFLGIVSHTGRRVIEHREQEEERQHGVEPEDDAEGARWPFDRALGVGGVHRGARPFL